MAVVWVACQSLICLKRIVIKPKFLLQTKDRVSRPTIKASSFRCNRTLYTWFVMILHLFFCSSHLFILFPESILFPLFFKFCLFYFLMQQKKKQLLKLLQLCQFFVIRYFHLWLCPSICVIPFFTGPFEDPQIAKEKRIATAFLNFLDFKEIL